MGKEKITKDVLIRVPQSLFDRFKEKCDLNYKSISEILRDAMQEYIKKNEKGE